MPDKVNITDKEFEIVQNAFSQLVKNFEPDFKGNIKEYLKSMYNTTDDIVREFNKQTNNDTWRGIKYSLQMFGYLLASKEQYNEIFEIENEVIKLSNFYNLTMDFIPNSMMPESELGKKEAAKISAIAKFAGELAQIMKNGEEITEDVINQKIQISIDSGTKADYQEKHRLYIEGIEKEKREEQERIEKEEQEKRERIEKEKREKQERIEREKREEQERIEKEKREEQERIKREKIDTKKKQNEANEIAKQKQFLANLRLRADDEFDRAMEQFPKCCSVN